MRVLHFASLLRLKRWSLPNVVDMTRTERKCRERCPVIRLVSANQEAIAELCLAYGVESLDVFGSAATGTFDEGSSDIDFIVTFADMSPGIANRYLDFVESLERLLGKSVDVMFDRSIENPYLRRSVEASRENIFERTARQEVV